MPNSDHAVFHCPGRLAAGPGSKPVCGAPDWNHDEHDYPERPGLTPQAALEQFERTTGYRIHAVTDAGGTVWWRQPVEQPMFECTIGDRCMHIDELSAPKP